MAKKSKKKLVWLEQHWEDRKKQTELRVKNAVDSLVKEGATVSVRRICEKVRDQTGRSISPNTIKQNSSAYEIYCRNASRRSVYKLKDSALSNLLDECSKKERPALQTKIARLKKFTKEALIADLIVAKREIRESRQIENRLRERLYELELFAHKNKVE